MGAIGFNFTYPHLTGAAMSNNFEDARTKPTIETVLDRINSLGDSLQGQLDTLQVNVGRVNSDVGAVKFEVGELRNEFQIFRGELELRIDRIESLTNQTNVEMLNLRADFREWKDQLKESDA
jgi:hypothetical protein